MDLRKAREKLKLTQAQAARRCRVSQATISEWETGSIDPDPRKWKQIAKVYRVPFDRLAEHYSS